MPKYFELDKAIEQFCSCGSVFTYGDNVCKAIVSRLKQVPTADVVEVVRCKDCVYLYRTAEVDMVYAFADHVCTYWESDGLYLDDYCSQGKRRKP